MIVSDEHMSAAVAVLTDADGTAEAYYQATLAENNSKEVFSRLYLSYAGSIDERKARVTINPAYMEAKAQEAESFRELERRKAELRSADSITEIWRTENANARYAEKVR